MVWLAPDVPETSSILEVTLGLVEFSGCTEGRNIQFLNFFSIAIGKASITATVK